MRVALLLSGHFRDAKSCFGSIQSRILSPLQPDVFISTWNPEDTSKHHSSLTNTEIPDSFTFEQIINSYRPKITRADDFDSPIIKEIIDKAWILDRHGPMNGEINPVSILCMWYKIGSALNLMEQYEEACGFRYDYVIKGRFDIVIHDDIQLGENENYINIPPGFDWRGGFNDIIGWGSRNAMAYYCSLFPKIEKYVMQDSVFFHPETILKHHLINSPYGVERPEIRVTLRDQNMWEIESSVNNQKKI